jgi:hypothetical protein
VTQGEQQNKLSGVVVNIHVNPDLIVREIIKIV